MQLGSRRWLASIVALLAVGSATAYTVGSNAEPRTAASVLTGGCDMHGVTLVCTPGSCAPLDCNTYITLQGGTRYYVCSCGSADSVICCQLGKRYSDGMPAAVGECSFDHCNEAFPECMLHGSGTSGDP